MLQQFAVTPIALATPINIKMLTRHCNALQHIGGFSLFSLAPIGD
jgi:hypothetical protein